MGFDVEQIFHKLDLKVAPENKILFPIPMLHIVGWSLERELGNSYLHKFSTM